MIIQPYALISLCSSPPIMFLNIIIVESWSGSYKSYDFPILENAFSLPHWHQANFCCSLKPYSQYNCLDLSLKIKQVLKHFYGNSGKKKIYFILRSSININIYIIEIKVWRNNNYYYSIWGKLPSSFPFHSTLLVQFILLYSIQNW